MLKVPTKTFSNNERWMRGDKNSVICTGRVYFLQSGVLFFESRSHRNDTKSTPELSEHKIAHFMFMSQQNGDSFFFLFEDFFGLFCTTTCTWMSSVGTWHEQEKEFSRTHKHKQHVQHLTTVGYSVFWTLRFMKENKFQQTEYVWKKKSQTRKVENSWPKQLQNRALQ